MFKINLLLNLGFKLRKKKQKLEKKTKEEKGKEGTRK